MAMRMIGGRMVEIPTDGKGMADVSEIRERADIPRDRTLVAQEPDGANRVLPKRGKVLLGPYTQFLDAPSATRGLS